METFEIPEILLDSDDENDSSAKQPVPVTHQKKPVKMVGLNSTLTSMYKSSNKEASKKDHSPSPKFYVDKTPSTSIETQKEPILDIDSNQPDVGNAQKRKKQSPTPETPNKRNRPNRKDVLVLEHSTIKFCDFGGCESQLLEVCKLLMHMKHPEIYVKLGVRPPRGFLLHGPPGSGKTMLAYAIAGELDLPFIKIASTEIVSGVSGESEQKIRDLFSQALSFAPCILFLDEIDAIAPRREVSQREMERRIVAQMLSSLDDLERSDKNVLVIGATNRPDSLDPALRRAGRFDKEIGLGIPDEKSRQKILEVVCRELRLEENFDKLQLAHLTPGYVGADLSALAREACVFAVDRVFRDVCKNDSLLIGKDELYDAMHWLKEKPIIDDCQLEGLFVQMDDFLKALKTVSPSAKREGFATVPDVSWSDVGALNDIREDLKWSILYPIKCPEAFESLGLASKPQGILLCGPPGCGKTLLAKAVANESGMNFISVKGPELLSMYVGESEKAVRQIFQRAKNSSPCVIFFDELDALCPRRSDHESGGTVRVVNQLLTEMDGIESRKQVFLIGATNRPDIIDPAILRPGRLDKILCIGFPSVDDKIDILKAITKNGKQPHLEENFDFKTIAGDVRAEYFTGADLAALVHDAAILALKEQIGSTMGVDFDQKSFKVQPCVVGEKHFQLAFDRVKPSVSEKQRETYKNLMEKYNKR